MDLTSRNEEVAGIPTSPSAVKKHPRSNFNESEIDRVNNQIKIFMKKIHSENERIKYLNDQICLQEAKAMEQKRREAGDGISDRESTRMIDKQCLVLEDRLNHSLVAFNTKVAENKTLRRKIDEMVSLFGIESTRAFRLLLCFIEKLTIDTLLAADSVPFR